MLSHCSFDATKYKLGCYRGKDCMEMFSKDLKEHVTKIIKYEKRKMIPLTYEENQFYEKEKVCYNAKKD